MSNALEVRGISLAFGSLKAVDDVSFSIPSGMVYGFIGPNGAGKTTTMRICATLQLPDEGDVLIDGYSVLDEPRLVRECLGFMPDQYGAYSSTTVFDYLDFFARAYGLKGKQRRTALSEVMDFTSLGPLGEKMTNALSKGMRQRLCLAKTLLHDPSVLILDEPAAGLDPRARIELRELLRALAEMGKAVLISSHILTELSEVCDGVAIIEAGRIQATGSVEDIVKGVRPHNEIYVRCLEPEEVVERALLEMPGVGQIRPIRGGLAFDFMGTQGEQAGLLEHLMQLRLRPVEFASQETDLEDLFLHLTEGKVQ
ncbi:MAG: ABC-2 type transport system ATP-binding protein [Planctomycetota bacterium]|jgi:ABC-2 type transport system ATP-binding protein